MAPPKRPWLRLYVETVWDRKIRRLPVAYRWLWIALLACARQSPIPGHLLVSEKSSLLPEDIADAAAMSLKDVTKGLDRLVNDGLIEWDHAVDAWYIPKWGDRQYESDDTTQRTRKHRSKEQGRNVPSTPDGTHQIQRQITETDTEAEIPPLTPPQSGREQTKTLREKGENPRAKAAARDRAEIISLIENCSDCSDNPNVLCSICTGLNRKLAEVGG